MQKDIVQKNEQVGALNTIIRVIEHSAAEGVSASINPEEVYFLMCIKVRVVHYIEQLDSADFRVVS